MADLLTESFGLLSTKNLVLPHETVDEALRRYILSNCTKSLIETRPHRLWLLEATKRWEALRSTRSLDADDPRTPWHWASNVGIPLEAIAGEATFPRLNGSTIYADPIFRVHVTQDTPDAKTAAERLTAWYQDVNVSKIKLPVVRNDTYLNLLIDGDGIEGPEWVEEARQIAKTVAVFQNAKGEFLVGDDGVPKVFHANAPEPAWPKDPKTDKPLKRVLVQMKHEKIVYKGPKVRAWRLAETIWTPSANSPEIDELDWFAVQAWKSLSWFETRQGDPLQGKLKDIDTLIDRYKNGVPAAFDTEIERQLTSGIDVPKVPGKILTWLWFGKFDVDKDGIDEEVIAWVAPKERMLLGWRLSPFLQRPFFHYQLYRLPGRFTGRGLPHVLKGMRDMADFYANSANNSMNLSLRPPVLWESDSGFDPDTMQFGTGASWGPLMPGSNATNKIKMLSMPEGQEAMAERFILFYQSMTQRLTGTTDMNLGMSSRGNPGVRTKGAALAMLQESNSKFGDWVHKFQRIAEEEQTFIDSLLVELADQDTLRGLSSLPLTEAEIALPKRFHATGDSETMNRQAQKEVFLHLFEVLVQDPIFGLMPETQLQLRQRLNNLFDLEISLPKADQIKQMQLQHLAEALAALPPEKLLAAQQKVQQAQQGQGGEGQGQGAPTNGAPKTQPQPVAGGAHGGRL